jgi:hypothetical protein
MGNVRFADDSVRFAVSSGRSGTSLNMSANSQKATLVARKLAPHFGTAFWHNAMPVDGSRPLHHKRTFNSR